MREKKTTGIPIVHGDSNFTDLLTRLRYCCILMTKVYILLILPHPISLALSTASVNLMYSEIRVKQTPKGKPKSGCLRHALA